MELCNLLRFDGPLSGARDYMEEARQASEIWRLKEEERQFQESLAIDLICIPSNQPLLLESPLDYMARQEACPFRSFSRLTYHGVSYEKFFGTGPRAGCCSVGKFNFPARSGPASAISTDLRRFA